VILIKVMRRQVDDYKVAIVVEQIYRS
jgi:hypothetical protein